MPNLYELSNQYLYLNTLLENEEIDPEAIQDTLEAIEDEIEVKIENIVKLMKNIEGDIDAFKTEEKRLADRRKALENKYNYFKQYIQDSMIKLNKKNIKTGLFTISFQKSPPSVEIVDEKSIPHEYIAFQIQINKKQLLEDLKNGKEVKGVVLVKDKEHLRIR